MQQHNIPGPSRPPATGLPGQLHTPNQSFSEATQTPDSTKAGQLAGWMDKKLKEETDMAKSRLSDQKFNMSDYADPLLPRQHPQSKYYPKGATAETEAHLQAVITAVKAANQES
ncbi:hypothetical protein F4779DRAFT_70500 [Xylariaceae sp. FL0662B]|nr:hypothetical protein F4779DRAFT_70500 [Xylariaceae sp. FL0662B]